MDLPLENKKFAGLVLVALALFFFTVLGFVGLKTILAVLLLFVLPFYLLLRKWFSEEESVFYAFFVGMGIFSTLVYNIGFITGIKWAIAITFIVLIALVFVLKKKKPSHTPEVQTQQ